MGGDDGVFVIQTNVVPFMIYMEHVKCKSYKQDGKK